MRKSRNGISGGGILGGRVIGRGIATPFFVVSIFLEAARATVTNNYFDIDQASFYLKMPCCTGRGIRANVKKAK